MKRRIYLVGVLGLVLIPSAFACMGVMGCGNVTLSSVDFGSTAALAVSSKRAWGPEQATGAPDTSTAGDMITAWASLLPDDQDEWLLLTYKKAAVPAEILIYETYNPGAVYRVTVFRGRKEVEVWSGTDPVPADNPVSGKITKGVAKIPVDVSFSTKQVKVYLHSTMVPGWNEIDAVGIKDAKGKIQWASRARASSTYANPGPVVPYVDPYEDRLRNIEGRLEDLQKKH